MPELPAPVLKREWGTREGRRETRAGMWAWLIQRGAAVVLIVTLVLHLRNPFVRWVQAFLLAFVLLHGLLGVRVILLDVGLPVRWQKALFAAAILLAVVLFAAFWAWRWY